MTVHRQQTAQAEKNIAISQGAARGNGLVADITQALRLRGMSPEQKYSQFFSAILAAMEPFVVGRRQEIETIIHTMMAEGHVLFEGPSGFGKTYICNVYSKIIGLPFSKITCTPDLLPAQVVGYAKPVPSGETQIKLGPIHNNVVLGDEINRATPETQSAFLEAMNSAEISLDGQIISLPRPFVFIATQNPLATWQGTYPLIAPVYDRFAVRLVPRPYTSEEYVAIMHMDDNNKRESVEPQPQVGDGARWTDEMTALRRQVRFQDGFDQWLVTSAMKLDPLEESALPNVRDCVLQIPSLARAFVYIQRLAQSHALASGKLIASKEDARPFLASVFAHRLELSDKGEAEVRRRRLQPSQLQRELVEEAFS